MFKLKEQLKGGGGGGVARQRQGDGGVQHLCLLTLHVCRI